ncbi:MAG: D-alanyl-D-alanine carboxypeptidase/D-alanyl-D-alanine-endopeptidase [Bacteroidales bacterium]|nr:D-alanyl-D-alanine carboxypeptidase/D-alanyl-D-alanine-endopeptidase [Bacteroidales bacterium]
MRQLIFLIFSLIINIIVSQTVSNIIPKPIDTQIAIFEKDSDLKNASISFLAIDVSDGTTVSELNPDMSLIPASVQKAVTTATILELFGSGHRFVTKIEYNGEIDSNGVLNGDLYITGGGDPALGSRFYKDHYGNFISAWADSVEKIGIKTINGRIIADESIFPVPVVPGSWTWSDIGNYFGAYASGLTIFDNTYELSFSSGLKNGDSTRIDSIIPKIPNMVFLNKVKSSDNNSDNAYIYGGPYSDFRIIHGTIPKGKKDFRIKGSIPNPALLAAEFLKEKLIAKSINIVGETTTSLMLELDNNIDTLPRKTITQTLSPTLASLVNQTNMVSYNLFAEHFVKHLGVKRYSCGDTYSGTMAVENFWASKGIDTKGMYINDGCGLSRMNVITARQICGILSYMYKSKNKKVYFESLPVSGKSGTMSSFARGTSTDGKIHAKTGTISRVRSFAGYIEANNGKVYSFSIIVNNFNCSSNKMKKKIETVLTALMKS